MKILVGGDVAPKLNITELIEKNDFSFFSELQNLSKEYDTTIINLESPFADTCDAPIEKYGPNLKCSPSTVKALEYAGVNVVTLANNHILDYGHEALLRTKAICEQNGILTIGVGQRLSQAQNPLILEANNCRIGLINCCEHEFSIATESDAGANPLDPISQFYAIRKLKPNVDYLIVIVHGGHEHYNLPSTRMQKLYRFFIDSGADVVINHHQHCFSGYEQYNEGLIFYGLGNLCFPAGRKVNDSWYKGYMVGLEFMPGSKIKFKIHPYEQCYNNNPAVHFLSEDAFSSDLEDLNKIISSTELLQNRERAYYDSWDKTTYSNLDILTNRYLIALRNKGLLPKFLSHKYLLRLKNHVLCESHLDKVQHFLKKV
ncbi:MAG: CapA family protein [Muribaculaceae bacterium]|nr:CapA family protein [Muribaculaceae bacterium]